MTEENLGGEAGLIEERKKKLKLLRESNKAYVNDFDRTHRAEAIIAGYQEFSKTELEEKNIDWTYTRPNGSERSRCQFTHQQNFE